MIFMLFAETYGKIECGYQYYLDLFAYCLNDIITLSLTRHLGLWWYIPYFVLVVFDRNVKDLFQ